MFLYNRWHQWWSLNFRSISEYFWKALSLPVMVLVFMYLLVISGFILIRINIRLGLINLKAIIRKENGKRCKAV